MFQLAPIGRRPVVGDFSHKHLCLSNLMVINDNNMAFPHSFDGLFFTPKIVSIWTAIALPVVCFF